MKSYKENKTTPDEHVFTTDSEVFPKVLVILSDFGLAFTMGYDF